MTDEVSCVVPPWGSYVVPVVRHRRLGGTTLASVKNESVARSVGAFIMACFLFFQWMRKIKMVVACHEVFCLAAMEDGMGLNAASIAFGIPKPTIRRQWLGLNKYASEDVKYMGGPLSLPAAVEDELIKHIKHVKDLDDMMFSMTATYLMGLTYEVAVAHGIKKFSNVKKSAGKKWYYNCMRRHPDLSLRSLSGTSFTRARRRLQSRSCVQFLRPAGQTY